MFSKLTKSCIIRCLTVHSLYIPLRSNRYVVFGKPQPKWLKSKYPLYNHPIRSAGELIPPTQYDSKFPERLKLFYALRHYWELYPLVIVTAAAVAACIGSILWAINNKVDVVFTSHNRLNISRTMDLRNPTVHKLFIINQRYKAWPEMQDALDKIAMAEKRALVRLQSCSHA